MHFSKCGQCLVALREIKSVLWTRHSMYESRTISKTKNFPMILDAARSTSISPAPIPRSSFNDFAAALTAPATVVGFFPEPAFHPDCTMPERVCDAELAARIAASRLSSLEGGVLAFCFPFVLVLAMVKLAT